MLTGVCGRLEATSRPERRKSQKTGRRDHVVSASHKKTRRAALGSVSSHGCVPLPLGVDALRGTAAARTGSHRPWRTNRRDDCDVEHFPPDRGQHGRVRTLSGRSGQRGQRHVADAQQQRHTPICAHGQAHRPPGRHAVPLPVRRRSGVEPGVRVPHSAQGNGVASSCHHLRRPRLQGRSLHPLSHRRDPQRDGGPRPSQW
ncbi:hypothetical protein TNIN_377531 [Trichonephila inaurata madagascariensis]|uniref:Uncharacterized protein n=1 Tax=Trichonephila inaurata madagascariensis TaxID=2747483 RepID=A0A8X6YGQ2_9ARAC|nr:hypothetical protein TNIN_377531 [Trichonephila inaurata madagascariensis]